METDSTTGGSETARDESSNGQPINPDPDRAAQTKAVNPDDLTDFKLRILAVLAEESRYGLAVKEELEDYYGKEVNHGRLYPNLDDLVNKGLVAKRELDKRTNEYSLTQDGASYLVQDLQWLLDRVDPDIEKNLDAADGQTHDESGTLTQGGAEGSPDAE